MAPSLGFDVPIVGLLVGMAVLVAGMFVGGGLNLVTYVGIAIAFAGIVGLWLAVIDTSEPGHERTG